MNNNKESSQFIGLIKKHPIISSSIAITILLGLTVFFLFLSRILAGSFVMAFAAFSYGSFSRFFSSEMPNRLFDSLLIGIIFASPWIITFGIFAATQIGLN